ncbi:MAG: fructosamine kinase family protein [Spirochaetales bacterium]|nr:fructosamine kinase family protein [Spirochaetales bacterium]
MSIVDRIARRERIYGGDINKAWRLELDDGSTVFMKMNAPEKAAYFEAESAGLEAMRATGTIGIPKVLEHGKTEDYSYLILEFLKPANRIKDYWETFGRELALMHKASGGAVWGKSPAMFGFPSDNFIGHTKQINTPSKSWVAFYRDCRLVPQLKMADRYFDSSIRKKFTHLLDHLQDYLEESESPALLHGDLWSGNMLCGPDGKAWILDPTCYYGHPEVDLAMTQLFSQLPSAFYSAYNEINKISPEYADRRDLYHLYQLLNHLNMFGSSYYGEVTAILDEYA